MESTPTNRLIGVEIECVLPIIGTGDGNDVQRLLAEVLSNHGIRSVARGYTHSPIPRDAKLAIEYDVSLRDESKYAGLRWAKVECKTMPMTFGDIEQVLPKALDIIKYCGARVNYSCGLHVHHHVPEVNERPEVARSLQHLWWRFHRVMYGLVAPSRIGNTYCCHPNQSDASRFDAISSYSQLCGNLRSFNRYNGLNFANLSNQSRQTIEWRIHSGTTDWTKIRAWILATQRWTEHSIARNCHLKSTPMANTQAGLNSLLVTTGLKTNSRIYRKVDKELRQVSKYLLSRWKHFNLPREFKNQSEAA